MWRYIEVSNYRSIGHAEVLVPPFAAVVGPNGSGKSNFVDAFVFARDVGFDASGAIERRGGVNAVRRWSPSKPFDVTIDVSASKSKDLLMENRDYIRHRFVIKSGKGGSWKFGDELVEHVAGGEVQFQLERRGGKVVAMTPAKVLPSDAISDTSSLMIYAKQLRQFRPSGLNRVRQIRLAPLLMKEPQVARLEAVELEEDGRNIAVALRSLHETESLQRVLEPMRKIIPGLVDVSVETLGRHLVLKFTQRQGGNRRGTFYAGDISEGALRALGIVVACEQMRRDELLVLEEPEVNLHVGAAGVLFDVLKEASRKGAVLLTTHSAELLDAAREEEILVCEYSRGTTHVGPLSTGQRQVVRDGLFSVAELMRSEPLRIDGGDRS